MKLFQIVRIVLFITLVTAVFRKRAFYPRLLKWKYLLTKRTLPLTWRGKPRLAAQIVDAIFDGEPIWLEADKHKFLGVSMASLKTDADSRAVLIIHGAWLSPLIGSRSSGPYVLILQNTAGTPCHYRLPVLEKDATYYKYIPIFPEAFPRIEAGIKYLKEQGNDHGCCHCSQAVVCIWRWNGFAIVIFQQWMVLLALVWGATDYQQTMKDPFPRLKRLPYPVLDIYGAMDYPAVAKSWCRRIGWLLCRQTGNAKSNQVILEDADHYMHEQDEVLIETVGGLVKRCV